jgi:hypothetical protein
MNLDNAIRMAAYDVTTLRGAPPTIAELAGICDVPVPAAHESVRRLAAARTVVLQPASGELLMVPPFSAVPTAFVVRTSRYTAYANCVWDAIGVSVVLQEPVDVVAWCGCCGKAMPLAVHNDRPPDGSGAVHFAIPARRWWDDIAFT